MAQAARLNLRMQKEVKLLLTDPPPGASFPTLSDDSSLTSIDAQVQGPEGTVYSNGVFKIKIQIPERYPFQPPIVTFATPIYHPNIDNGGRICLDILNLPPKGMWQPSLNISTVLTSIGLLLSEPNPDDGLMHEASRDYKYNRQAFDLNARSMTEKYARAGETESARGSHGMAHVRLGSSSNEAANAKEIYTHDNSKNNIEFGAPLKEANNDLSNCTGKRNKLSLKVSVASHSRNYETTCLPSHLLEIQTTCTDSLLSNIETNVSQEQQSSLCVGMGQSINSDDKQQGLACSYNAHISRKGNHSRLEEIGLVGKNHLVDENETNQSAAASTVVISSDNGLYCNEPYSKLKKEKINEVCRDKSEQVGAVEGSQVAEAVIVLDSEDEDEGVPVRSKLSLAKRCCLRKSAH